MTSMPLNFIEVMSPVVLSTVNKRPALVSTLIELPEVVKPKAANATLARRSGCKDSRKERCNRIVEEEGGKRSLELS